MCADGDSVRPCDDAFVIESAGEFVRLRSSADPGESQRAAHDEASERTWRDVIARFPEMRVWVAQNKTVPLSVLEDLRTDPDERVRSMVRAKGEWRRAHPEDAKRLGDPPVVRPAPTCAPSAAWVRRAGMPPSCQPRIAARSSVVTLLLLLPQPHTVASNQSVK